MCNPPIFRTREIISAKNILTNIPQLTRLQTQKARYNIFSKRSNGKVCTKVAFLYFRHRNISLPIELIKYIEFVHLLCHLADQKIDIILGDIETGVPEQL